MHILDQEFECEITRKLLVTNLLNLREYLNSLFEDLIPNPLDKADLEFHNESYYNTTCIDLIVKSQYGGKLQDRVYLSDLIVENLDVERYINALLWKWTEHMNGIYTGKWARQWILGEK